MTEQQSQTPKPDIAQTYELDAAPQKVWRAISTPEFRERWLPAADLAEPNAASCKPGEEISYRMREKEPPFLESTVTFSIAPNDEGGTRLQISHVLSDIRLKRPAPAAANANGTLLMRAA